MRSVTIMRKLSMTVVMTVTLVSAACSSSMSSQPPRSTRATEVVHLVAQTETYPHITWLTVTGAEGNLWLLGEHPCSSGTCLAIFESENGGATFTQVGVPPVRAGFFGTQADITPRGLPTGSLLFANREDGYAYSSGGPTGEDSFYWTGDGGTTWQRVQLGGALAAPVVVADGRAYAVTYECRSATCSSYDLVSSPVAENDWTAIRNFLLVETKGEGQNVSLSAFGSSIWLVLTPQGGGQGGRLLVSRDYGRVWSALPPDQIGGAFSCSITATSVQTLWGTCYGLHSSATVRSTDGGRLFFGIKGSSPLPDVSLFPLSDQEAVLLDSFTGSWNLEVTTDGGRNFRSVLANRELFAVGFATGTTWVVLGGPNNGGANALYRTTNSGRSWQPLKAPTVGAVPSVASCKASQLMLGFFGSGVGNPGQAVAAIRVTDSSRSCSLRGYPAITFLNKAGAVMPVTVGHTTAFYGVLATVVVSPGNAGAAGFLMTGYDFPATGVSCPAAALVRVRLPKMTTSFTVATPTRLCRLAVDVSPIVKGAKLAPLL